MMPASAARRARIWSNPSDADGDTAARFAAGCDAACRSAPGRNEACLFEDLEDMSQYTEKGEHVGRGGEAAEF